MPRGPRTGHRWRQLRAEVLSSSQVCVICGKRIPDVRWPHPLSGTVHHIVALARGGPPLDPANLAPAHKRCNEQQGARLRSRSRHSRAW